MSDIPKSSWAVNKVYFKVKLVEDFTMKMIGWLQKHEHYTTREALSLVPEIADIEGRYRAKGYLYLYQYPMEPNNQCFSKKIIEEQSDYFEKEDDNLVIPYHLWEMIE